MEEQALNRCLKLFKQCAGWLPLTKFDKSYLRSIALQIEGLCRDEYVTRFQEALESAKDKVIYFLPNVHPAFGSSTPPDSVVQSQKIVFAELQKLRPVLIGIEGSSADPYTIEARIDLTIEAKQKVGMPIDRSKERTWIINHHKHSGVIRYIKQAASPIDCFGAEFFELGLIGEYMLRYLPTEYVLSGLFKSAEQVRAEGIQHLRSLMVFTRLVERMQKTGANSVAIAMGGAHKSDFVNLQKILGDSIVIIDCVPENVQQLFYGTG